MSRPGTEDRPLRVAIVGSGPAAFYTVQALQRAKGLASTIDMFERLPTPFGLVRFGVAPDHPKIKKVVAVYEKLARDDGFRFFGNVNYGTDITLDDLRAHYDQVVFATGAQTDRRLGIPGEDLTGSHPATEFVAWYNGHPDYVDHQFDLSVKAAVVIGVGNVAVDVARILCRTPDELLETDIADHALEALRDSRIEDVYLVGRRGPAQAAFTNPEAKELGELVDADAIVRPDEIELDEISRKAIETDASTSRKIDILREIAGRKPGGKSKRLTLRFLTSPVELIDDGSGGVGAVRMVRNRLEDAGNGRTRAVPTDAFETVDAGLVFRSVGYRGVPLADIPFRDDWGTVPTDCGRVLDGVDGSPIPGVYVSGWIKRGPSGVIGTNKPDAVETVDCMLEDLQHGATFEPTSTPEAIRPMLVDRGIDVVTWDDWRRIDVNECETGAARGRPRVKLTRRADFMGVLGRT